MKKSEFLKKISKIIEPRLHDVRYEGRLSGEFHFYIKVSQHYDDWDKSEYFFTNKVTYSRYSGGDYWVGEGESMTIDDEFQFSEFKGVDWTEKFISLNSNNDAIDDLESTNDELNFELIRIQQKICSAINISGDIDLTDYLAKLGRNKLYLEKAIEENLNKIKELKKP